MILLYEKSCLEMFSLNFHLDCHVDPWFLFFFFFFLFLSHSFFFFFSLSLSFLLEKVPKKWEGEGVEKEERKGEREREEVREQMESRMSSTNVMGSIPLHRPPLSPSSSPLLTHISLLFPSLPLCMT